VYLNAHNQHVSSADGNLLRNFNSCVSNCNNKYYICTYCTHVGTGVCVRLMIILTIPTDEIIVIVNCIFVYNIIFMNHVSIKNLH